MKLKHISLFVKYFDKNQETPPKLVIRYFPDTVIV